MGCQHCVIQQSTVGCGFFFFCFLVVVATVDVAVEEIERETCKERERQRERWAVERERVSCIKFFGFRNKYEMY